MKISENSSPVIVSSTVAVEAGSKAPPTETAKELFTAAMDLEPYQRGRANDLSLGGNRVTPELVKSLEQSCEKLEPGSLTQTDPSAGQILAPKADSAFESARNDFHGMKDAFGGAPNFPEHKPTREPNTRSFAGIPIESVQTWVSKGLKNYTDSFAAFLLHPVYQLGAKLFGVKEPQTKYEYISTHLESMAYLEANPSIIQSFKNGTDATALLGQATGLTCHVSDNGSVSVGVALEEHLSLLGKYIEHNKAQGPDALKAFFNEAFDDGAVCFEARMTHFNTYVASHPLDGSKPQSTTYQLDLERVPFTKVMEHDFGNFVAERSAAGLSAETPKISEFDAYLKRTYGESGLVGKPCVDESKSEKGLDDTFTKVVTKPIEKSDLDEAFDYIANILSCADDDRVNSNWQSV